MEGDHENFDKGGLDRAHVMVRLLLVAVQRRMDRMLATRLREGCAACRCAVGEGTMFWTVMGRFGVEYKPHTCVSHANGLHVWFKRWYKELWKSLVKDVRSLWKCYRQVLLTELCEERCAKIVEDDVTILPIIDHGREKIRDDGIQRMRGKTITIDVYGVCKIVDRGKDYAPGWGLLGVGIRNGFEGSNTYKLEES